jgi:S-adenosylmethionine synthetase
MPSAWPSRSSCQYRALVAYGHMGRIDISPLPGWEKTDRAAVLKKDAGL